MAHAVLLALLGLLLSACAGTKDIPAASGPRKLYIDANLGFSVTVPADWTRRFVAVPPGGTGAYAVRWLPDVSGQKQPDSLLEISRLSPPIPQDTETVLELVKSQWPAFVVTRIDDGTPGRLDLVGHTANLTILVRVQSLNGQGFVLALATPPERFDLLRRGFNLVAESLAPLPE